MSEHSLIVGCYDPLPGLQSSIFYLGTLLTAVIGIVLVPIPTPVLLRALLFHWARAVVWGMRWIGGMKVEFRGMDNLPAHGPVLLANKHHSESDGILLAAQIRGIAFVAMQELFRYPLIGAILYRPADDPRRHLRRRPRAREPRPVRQTRLRQRPPHRDLSRRQPDGAGRSASATARASTISIATSTCR